MKTVQVEITRLSHADELPLPVYQTEGSAGMDLAAAIDGVWLLEPLERRAVPTGLAIALPNGFEAQVRPRSGLAIKRGLTVVNAPGTIDSDYRGEIKVLMVNLSQQTVEIHRGQRIAQLVIAPICRGQWIEVDNLSTTERGAGGFGHTGQ